MSLLPVLTWPDARLQSVCAPVERVTPETERLADDMLETMYAAPGRGLAAPQVGELVRVFVMDAGWKDGAPTPMVFVNPTIVWTDDTVETLSEGCLSLPGVSADVSRPARVKIRWTGLDHDVHEQVFDGFSAACVQHEIDHLDGRMTLDHLDEDTRARVLRQYTDCTR